jgi:tetraprenyl-beta-curcumene synthase
VTSESDFAVTSPCGEANYDKRRAATLSASYPIQVDNRSVPLAVRFLTSVVPKASSELRRLRRRAQAIAEPDIRREALSSLRLKAFHVHGACVFATFLEPAAVRTFVRLAAAFETAVDYLDNLCDRIGAQDETDFRALHEALLDAVTPAAPPRPYFRHRPVDDSGYLVALVKQSQAGFAQLPGYAAARPHVIEITRRYCELQALKHLEPGQRERRCEAAFRDVAPDLSWWEGAAASGSTMATFALAHAAMSTSLDHRRAEAIFSAYFPYFTALHILLDYFVDQEEDREHGELNFFACYPDEAAARSGIARVAAVAVSQVARLDDADVHLFALRAMCGYYCTRPAARAGRSREAATAIMQTVGIEVDRKTGLPRIGDRRMQPLLDLYARMTRAPEKNAETRL